MPVAGAQPEIGRALWTLEDARHDTMRLLRDFDPAALDWQPEWALHSIGTLLYHIASVEIGWLTIEVLEKPEEPESLGEFLPLFPHDDRDAVGKLTVVAGESLDDASSTAGDSAARTARRVYSAMTLEEFRRLRSFADYDVTPEWVLHHLCQHEAEHRSEMSAVGRRLLNRSSSDTFSEKKIMAISFEIPEHIQQQTAMVQDGGGVRHAPVSRELDEHEHAAPDPVHRADVARHARHAEEDARKAGQSANRAAAKSASRTTNLRLMLMIEMLSWGDAGIYLCLPGGALGGAAIEAVGTPEQKIKFLSRFAEGDTPAWGAMAMTEPGAGSDTSAIRTSAVFDEATNEWVLNGEKIFCTNGKLALDEIERAGRRLGVD